MSSSRNPNGVPPLFKVLVAALSFIVLLVCYFLAFHNDGWLLSILIIIVYTVLVIWAAGKARQKRREDHVPDDEIYI